MNARTNPRHLAAALLALCTGGHAAAQPAPSAAAPPPPVVSPEIAGDGDVTLRIRAPLAGKVEVVSGGDVPAIPVQGGLPLTKGADGVWQATFPKLASGAYRYRFDVDGVATADPVNPGTSQSNGNVWSLFYVPGAKFMDEQRVAHGAVAAVHYYSAALGKDRRMHVYTPPGYERDRASYPVLYLLHGAFDSDDSWSTVGRAGFILDNLIASGAAKPMIVVMPDGHTSRFTPGPAAGPRSLNMEDFVREFNGDIRPYVESHYRALTDRRSTAIAGLSMGGMQTLDIAFGDLSKYAYVGVFSSGVFDVRESSQWEDKHRAQLDDTAAKRGLALVWFSTGRDDFLVETSTATVALLKKHGFAVTYEPSAGGHTWINWREYLNRFAPQLFR
ncbi:MAG TPA: alpha/beta hydrolase-fold protein [Gammaproteobacteria bacterium]|nr:alpha/beta hydrolase-fold protein [Gammaproteobacteria bacterium]